MVFVSGCAVGPEFSAPDISLPQQFSTKTAQAQPAMEGWWRRFQDPALDQLVDRALRDNLTLAQAQARVAAAQAQATAVDPYLDVTGRVAAQTSDGVNSAGSSSQSVLGTLSFTGARARRIESANAALSAARNDADAARLTVLSNVIIAVIDLRFISASLALRQQDQARQQRSLRDIQVLRDNGAATVTEVTQAEALIAETQIDIANQTGELARQANRVSTLLGLPAGLGAVRPSTGARQPLPQGGAPQGIPADLIRNRPDIRAAEDRYRAAVADIGVAEAARYPSLSLTGSITARSGATDAPAGILGAAINIPVFDQGARRAEVNRREAVAFGALLDWRARVLLAVEDVETALATLDASSRALRAANRLTSLRQTALDQSRDLLGNQAITISDFLDREVALSQARAARARARRDLAVNYVLLQIAQGAQRPAAAGTAPS
ncbi:efflux transporter outer membrane subunit [Sulfitobacter sabulilitoris]|nr:efflux transporter outer membrane subunit [Sulfitobacter sabulilitoris]